MEARIVIAEIARGHASAVSDRGKNHDYVDQGPIAIAGPRAHQDRRDAARRLLTSARVEAAVVRRAPRRVAFVGQPGVDLRPEPNFSIDIWTYEVARRLAAPYEPYVMCTQAVLGADREVDGVRYRAALGRTPALARVLNVVDYASTHGPWSDALFGSPFFCPRYAVRLALALRRERIDVVHVHNYFQALPIIRAINPAIEIVLHMHCGWLSGMNPRLVASSLRHARLVLGCSNFITNGIRAAFPAFADASQTVYNGVDVERFVRASTLDADAEPRILFVGRISPEKGLHVLLDAMSEVVRHHPHAHLDVVGPAAPQSKHFLAALGEPLADPSGAALASFYEGPGYNVDYLDRLRARVPDALRANVTFSIGSFAQGVVRTLYERATMLVNPSISESFGMTLVEAMAMGLPVVATRVGGIPEVVDDGTTGVLVPAGDARALATAMRRIVEDAAFARRLGTAGRERAVGLFSWDAVARRYEGAIERGLAPGR